MITFNPNYDCQICHKHFKNCGALTAHLKINHSNIMSYETYYLKYMNTKSIPGECVICGMPTKFINLRIGYQCSCSKKCATILNIKLQKEDNYTKAILTRSKTLKNKYNIVSDEIITSPFSIEQIRRKSKETLHKLHGDNIDNPFQVESIKKTIQKTMIEKYGGKTTLESKSLKNKVQQTNIKRFGGISPMCSETIRNSALDTIKNKFNYKEDITSPYCIKEICDKKEETNLEKYGYKCCLSNEKIREKCQKTLYDNFGCKYSMESSEIRSKMKRKIKYNNIWFDSKPEVAYYIWLKDHNVRFEYHPSLLYFSYNEKLYHYEPDFKVYNTFVEIKGLQFFEDHNPTKKMICLYTKNKTPEEIKLNNEIAEAKHQYMINNGIIIITNYNKYIQYVNNKYGKNFLNILKENSKNAD